VTLTPETRPRPNLFVIGAAKSGTSSLHEYLKDHPDIFMSDEKEPNFFVDEENFFDNSDAITDKEESYLNLFKSATGVSIIGESSTNYTRRPRYHCHMEMIFRYTSDPRFIYIMRDPIERTISHYWFMVHRGWEVRSIHDALREDTYYLEVSNYAMQLEPYFKTFGPERILTVTTEALASNPIAMMQSIYESLGVDPSHRPANAGMRYNTTPHVVRQKRMIPVINRLQRSRFWSVARAYAPKWFWAVSNSVTKKNVTVASFDRDAVIQYLRPLQQAETSQLSELLHRDFPEWTTLYGN
jgi:hypothetical protein